MQLSCNLPEPHLPLSRRLFPESCFIFPKSSFTIRRKPGRGFVCRRAPFCSTAFAAPPGGSIRRAYASRANPPRMPRLFDCAAFAGLPAQRKIRLSSPRPPAMRRRANYSRRSANPAPPFGGEFCAGFKSAAFKRRPFYGSAPHQPRDFGDFRAAVLQLPLRALYDFRRGL